MAVAVRPRAPGREGNRRQQVVVQALDRSCGHLVVRDLARVEDAEAAAQIGEVGARTVERRRHRVQREVEVVVRLVGRTGEELVPVPLGDLPRRAPGGHGADVDDHQLWPRRVVGMGPAERRREPEQRPVRVLWVNPEEHLVRLHLLTGDRGRHVARDEGRMHRIGEVEELDVERERRVIPQWAGVDDGAAAEGHHHQQLFLRPDAELACCDPDLAGVRRSDLTDHGRVRGICDVGDQDPWMRVRTGHDPAPRVADPAGIRAVGAVPDVDVVVVDRERGVHAAREERIRPDQCEIERRTRSSASRSNRHVTERDER